MGFVMCTADSTGMDLIHWLCLVNSIMNFPAP